MDTIRAFIEGLFAAYKDSPEVRQAKKELYEMMEDKYLDLKSQGKSENEAVGEVIASIGTIEELEEELHFSSKDQELKDSIYLTKNQIHEFLEDRRRFGSKVSFGVSLCILAVAPMIALLGLNLFDEKISVTLGLVILLSIIAFAVKIFVQEGFRISPYEEYERTSIDMESEMRSLLVKEQGKFSDTYLRKLSTGIALCILAVIPVAVISILFGERENLVLLSIPFMFLLISIGVKFIIEAMTENGSYDILLGKGDYRNKRTSKLLEDVGGIYWTLAVVIYILWSFKTGNWHITWIIWPIAGVLYSLVATIINIVVGKNENSYK